MLDQLSDGEGDLLLCERYREVVRELLEYLQLSFQICIRFFTHTCYTSNMRANH